MRWGIVGAGAIGTYVGARLAMAHKEVVLLARATQADVLRERGLTLRDGSGSTAAEVAVESDPARIGVVDVLVLSVKAHQLRDALPAIAAMSGPATTIVSMQNGIPWWYTLGHPRAGGWQLASVDPRGALARAIPVERVLAASLYIAATVPEPGVVRHTHGDRIVLGAAAPAGDELLAPVAEVLARAGFRAETSDEPRREVWAKLLGNAAFNPISALTRSTMGTIMAQPRALQLARAVMSECLAVASALGDEPAVDVERRIAQSPRDDTKTSMLQDLEAGRPLELDPLLGAVVELGERCGVAVPFSSAVYGLASLVNASLRTR
ncbi:MAG TPA: 2-dehydropantoate 2-reductase [Candidatus Sulfotelmatobacter sp.]|nr:2-dehydropantoate 2-reductase [Candidatus Sulfotelmatobacter sp.]